MGVSLPAHLPATLTRSRGGSSTSPRRPGCPEIDLHDLRTCYATLRRDAKIDWKALSQLPKREPVIYHGGRQLIGGARRAELARE